MAVSATFHLTQSMAPMASEIAFDIVCFYNEPQSLYIFLPRKCANTVLPSKCIGMEEEQLLYYLKDHFVTV